MKKNLLKIVVCGGTSFSFLESQGFHDTISHAFQIGAKYGNIQASDVLYGRVTIRERFLLLLRACKDKLISICSGFKARSVISYTIDMTTDDVNKNSYLDMTLFGIITDKSVLNLSHSSFSCKHFPERHTAANISCLIKEALRDLTLEDDTPSTTDKSANVVCALNFAARIDCACHRLNTVIEPAWSEIKQCNSDLNDLDKFTKELARYGLKLPVSNPSYQQRSKEVVLIGPGEI